MSKRVHFVENLVSERPISDRSAERRRNTQTHRELRLAMASYYKEAQDIIDKQQQDKINRKKIPISSRVKSAVRKGMDEAFLHREKIAQEYSYAYWWLGGNKQRRKTRKTRKNSY